MNRNEANLEQLQRDFWQPLLEPVDVNDFHMLMPEDINHEHIHLIPAEGDHIHLVQTGRPLFMPFMPISQIQRNNVGPPVPVCESIEIKTILELLKSYDPEDKNQLNSIVAYIAKNNKQVLCSYLLNNGYEVDVLNENNQTMLHIAFYYHSDIIASLIMSSPSFKDNSIDCADSRGLTHLHIACSYGHVELAERYLKTGSEINTAYNYDTQCKFSQFTPLHFAVVSQQEKIVKLLLKYGADVNFTNLQGQMSLHICCCNKNVNLLIMKDLISDTNIDINAKDNQGNTPLLSLLCAKCEQHNPFRYKFQIDEIESRFDLLVEAGADVGVMNKEGNTALHLLIKNLRFGHNPRSFGNMSFIDTDFVRLIKRVLDANSQIVNLKNKLGETPLQLAVSYLSLDIVQLLLDYKASLDDLKIDLIYYPNIIPIFEPVHNLIAIVQLLSEKGRALSSAEENIKILKFLVHEASNCDCHLYPHECDARIKFDMILNFGSPRHVIDTFNKRSNIRDAARYYKTFINPMQCYSDLANTGKFYVDRDIKRLLHELVGNVYTQDLVYEANKQTELKQLESAVMNNEMRLQDMMLKDPHDITRLINNSDFSPTFTKAFPLFEYIVKGHITKALIRSYVEGSTYQVLKHKLLYSLPDLCCDMILQKLSNLDILNMYAAAAQ